MEDYYRWQHKLVINKTAVLYVGQMTTKYRICRLYLEKKNLPGYCTISLHMALVFAMALVQSAKNYLALRVVIDQNSIP